MKKANQEIGKLLNINKSMRRYKKICLWKSIESIFQKGRPKLLDSTRDKRKII